jgi:phosphohistidine phosphatase SixA
MRRSALIALLLLAAGGVSPGAASTDAALAALRAGGHVLFLRHAETGPAWPDQPQAVLGDCDTQRDLNAAGRTQARNIGAAIAASGIAVGPVLASPFCRSVETAALAFGRAVPEPALSLPADTLSPGAHAAMGFSLAALLARLPAGAENLALVGHSYHVMALGAPLPEPQGTAVVLRREPGGGVTVVGLVPPWAWALPRLAEAR